MLTVVAGAEVANVETEGVLEVSMVMVMVTMDVVMAVVVMVMAVGVAAAKVAAVVKAVTVVAVVKAVAVTVMAVAADHRRLLTSTAPIPIEPRCHLISS